MRKIPHSGWLELQGYGHDYSKIESGLKILDSNVSKLSDENKNLSNRVKQIEKSGRNYSSKDFLESIVWVAALFFFVAFVYWLTQQNLLNLGPDDIQVQITWDFGDLLFGAFSGVAALIAALTYRSRSKRPDTPKD